MRKIEFNLFVIILFFLSTFLFILFFLIYLNSKLLYLENFLNGKYSEVNRYLSFLNDSVGYLNYKTIKNENSISQLKDKVDNLEYEIRKLNMRVSQKGLVNPSLEELRRFIIEDDTNTFKWRNYTFTCTEFTNTFVKRFRERGYYSCPSYIEFSNENGAHMIVAVNTTDYGLVYVEPQSDVIIYNLNVGDNYCEKVDWNCKWIIGKISNCFEVKVVG